MNDMLTIYVAYSILSAVAYALAGWWLVPKVGDALADEYQNGAKLESIWLLGDAKLGDLLGDGWFAESLHLAWLTVCYMFWPITTSIDWLRVRRERRREQDAWRARRRNQGGHGPN